MDTYCQTDTSADKTVLKELKTQLFSALILTPNLDVWKS